LFGSVYLTNVAIAAVAARGQLVLTADLDLQVALSARGLDVVNFAWLRQMLMAEAD
jgi:hypothetical protein